MLVINGPWPVVRSDHGQVVGQPTLVNFEHGRNWWTGRINIIDVSQYYWMIEQNH